jgi:putative methyltransferase (TIGR04325 family)
MKPWRNQAISFSCGGAYKLQSFFDKITSLSTGRKRPSGSELQSRTFKTYSEALESCSKDAYEDSDIVKVVVEKNGAFRKDITCSNILDFNSIKTLVGVGLAARNKQMLRVIDFGGGGGYHFMIARTALGNDLKLRWNVVETTSMAREAQKLSTSELKFFDDIDSAKKDLGEVDFVFTSSALHYCSDPLFFLDKLLAIRAEHLFITRTGFTSQSDQIVTIQKSRLSENGPGPLPVGFSDKLVYYPSVFVPRKKVEEMLRERYSVGFCILEGESVYRAGSENINMYGYFCPLKN